jgi:iron complex transport system ATP-binding protein
MIGVRDLTTRLGGQEVLTNVTFAPTPGTITAICGPNGAGKTTVLRALAGLLPGGHPIPRDVAYLPQGARCAWALTVRQVAELGRIPHGDRNARAIDAALAACGITDLASRRIDRISGGQARRAMLARVLATEPKYLLLDEPVADLDPAACHDIMRLLRAFAAAGGTVVAVLHALDLAAAYADRLVVLQSGRMLADAPPASALPAAAAAFGMTLQPDAKPLLIPAGEVSDVPKKARGFHPLDP